MSDIGSPEGFFFTAEPETTAGAESEEEAALARESAPAASFGALVFVWEVLFEGEEDFVVSTSVAVALGSEAACDMMLYSYDVGCE